MAAPGHGVILARGKGKGGVGKTTVAASVAVALAERRLSVHLSTTDPAADLAATITGDALGNLTVSRIDPAAETAKYDGLSKVLRLSYENAAPSTMIGASNHFEVAIAAAVMLFGLSSGAALATVVGG